MNFTYGDREVEEMPEEVVVMCSSFVCVCLWDGLLMTKEFKGMSVYVH